MVYYHYCENCMSKVNDLSSKECKNCGYDLSNEKKCCFIEFPIVNQLTKLFKKSNFYRDIQYRFSRKKYGKNNIEDIYDGVIYRKNFMNHGVLSNPNNILLLWNTDGVPLFKSSKISIWPIFLVINELEPKLRFKSVNIIFAGMWYSTKKPDPSIFLELLYRELKILEKDANVIVPLDGIGLVPKVIKVILIAGTFNLPARCLVSDTTQFNGRHGCIKCYQEEESCKTAKGGNV